MDAIALVKQFVPYVETASALYEFFEEKMVTILDDIGRVAFQNAIRKWTALIGHPLDKDELNGVIIHFETAYGTFEAASDRVSTRHLIGDDIRSIVSLVTRKPPRKHYDPIGDCASSAILIAAIYRLLGKPRKVLEWGCTALKDFECYSKLRIPDLAPDLHSSRGVARTEYRHFLEAQFPKDFEQLRNFVCQMTLLAESSAEPMNRLPPTDLETVKSNYRPQT